MLSNSKQKRMHVLCKNHNMQMACLVQDNRKMCWRGGKHVDPHVQNTGAHAKQKLPMGNRVIGSVCKTKRRRSGNCSCVLDWRRREHSGHCLRPPFFRFVACKRSESASMLSLLFSCFILATAVVFVFVINSLSLRFGNVVRGNFFQRYCFCPNTTMCAE